ncbi:MAG: AcrR family transcriptional regulator [Halopseudomonas sp.]
MTIQKHQPAHGRLFFQENTMPRVAQFDRQVAVERALKLFWSRGYYASSMKHVEEALDMRPGSLYATFGSKSGLFAEALEEYASRIDADFTDMVESAPTVVEGLKRYLHLIARLCSRDAQMPAQACMLIKTILEVNAEAALVQQQAQSMLAVIEKRIGDVLEKARSEGELRADVDCRRLARMVQAQIIGLRAFAARDIPDDQLEALADDMSRLLDCYRAG